MLFEAYCAQLCTYIKKISLKIMMPVLKCTLNVFIGILNEKEQTVYGSEAVDIELKRETNK